MWQEAGGDERQLAILEGPGDELGPALCANREIEALVVYGSRKIALAVQRVARFKPASLHFGGPGVVVVGEGIHLKQMAAEIAAHAFTHNGQAAFSPKLVLVCPSGYATMRKLLAKRVLDLKSGPPLQNRTEIGPLPSSCRAQALHDGIERIVGHGGQLICGGKRGGNFVMPTMLGLGIRETGHFLETELCGPVIGISQIDELEALPEVLGSRRELAVSLFDADDILAADIARQLNAQAAYINAFAPWQDFAHCVYESAVKLDSPPPRQLLAEVQTQQRGYQFE